MEKSTQEQLDADWKTHWGSRPPNEDLMDWFEKYWIDHGGHELYFDVNPKNPNNWIPKTEENKVEKDVNQKINWIELSKQLAEHKAVRPYGTLALEWENKFWDALGGQDKFYTEEPATGRLIQNKYLGVPIEIIGSQKPTVSKEDYDKAVHELTEAIRLTAEYTMQETLPPLPGWDWYDALCKYAPEKAAQFTSSYTPPESYEDDIPQSPSSEFSPSDLKHIVEEYAPKPGAPKLNDIPQSSNLLEIDKWMVANQSPMLDLTIKILEGKGFDVEEVKTLAKEVLEMKPKTPHRTPAPDNKIVTLCRLKTHTRSTQKFKLSAKHLVVHITENLHDPGNVEMWVEESFSFAGRKNETPKILVAFHVFTPNQLIPGNLTFVGSATVSSGSTYHIYQEPSA